VLADVVVVGGGNAALCAALSARLNGATVVVLERASVDWRGGNSKYTRNVRCAHDGRSQTAEPYTTTAFLEDLRRVAQGEPFDEELARLMIERSSDVPAWMTARGVRWQPALRGTLALANTNHFFLGGGKALVNHYYLAAERLGVRVEYGTTVKGFRFSHGRCIGAVAERQGGACDVVDGRAFVVASGSYEANKQWLAKVWGDGVANFSIRGCAQNDGLALDALLEAGARPAGNRGAFHGIAVDARAPEYDGGIVTRVDTIPLGIVVNEHSARFYDEGEDIWPKRYAIWGRLIAEQDSQTAYSIFDSRATGRFIPPAYPPIAAPSIAELAVKLSLDRHLLESTVRSFNAATTCDPSDRYELVALDGRRTHGLSPDKTNWALPIDTPPYYAFPLRPGVTFTYFGVAVDSHARVATADGGQLANVFAAGEAMAGNILKRGYLAGVGMTIGTVFGEISGTEAARHARR
jgi:tricarballylate dehydrogenase